MIPERHRQVHGERAQLTLRNGFTAYSFNLLFLAAQMRGA